MSSIISIYAQWKKWCNVSVNRGIFGAAITIAILTLLVKGVSAIKDIVVVANFGLGDSLDEFLIACILPTFVISVFAGSFHSSFIPIFSEAIQKHGRESASRLFSNISLLAFGILFFISVVLGVFDSWLIHAIAFDFDVAKFNRTKHLFDQILPLIVISGMATFFGAVLNAHKKFSLTAVAPICTPLLIGLGVYLSSVDSSSELLVKWTIEGSLIELVLVIYGLYKLNFLRFKLTFNWNSYSKKVWNQYLPMVLGAFVMSGTLLIDQVMASWLPSGSISALNYSNKLPSLVFSLVSGAIGSAVLPYLSNQLINQEFDAMKRTLLVYSKFIIYASAPILILGILFAYPIVEFLFERKAFTSVNTQEVSEIFRWSLPQIPFYILGTLFARFVTVLVGNKILLYVAILNMSANMILNLILMRTMGVKGIALSTSIVYMISSLLLGYVLINALNNNRKLLRKT